jgi:hypothetical protein
MNKEMTSAILRGKKTQTRRVVKRFYDLDDGDKKTPLKYAELPDDLEFKSFQGYGYPCPIFYSKSKNKYFCGENIKYKVGEKIWVREPAVVQEVGFDCFYFYAVYLADNKKVKVDTPRFVGYDDENDCFDTSKSPEWINEGRGIPNGCIKEMARIFLIITSVRVERLHDCYSFENFKAEGLSLDDESGIAKLQEELQDEWAALWNKTAPKGYKWEDNPYVFVYEFAKKEGK